MPYGSKAALRAIDGSTTEDVRERLRRLPTDATHLTVSAGGNVALNSSDILSKPAKSTVEALLKLAEIADQFESRYRDILTEVLTYDLPTAIRTVYYPRFPDPALQRVAATGLTMFNDCIVRTAFVHGIRLRDLRFICTEEGDYANPIEPSAQGEGRFHDRGIGRTRFASGRTEVFT